MRQRLRRLQVCQILIVIDPTSDLDDLFGLRCLRFSWIIQAAEIRMGYIEGRIFARPFCLLPLN